MRHKLSQTLACPASINHVCCAVPTILPFDYILPTARGTRQSATETSRQMLVREDKQTLVRGKDKNIFSKPPRWISSYVFHITKQKVVYEQWVRAYIHLSESCYSIGMHSSHPLMILMMDVISPFKIFSQPDPVSEINCSNNLISC